MGAALLAALPGRLLASAKNAELEDGSKKKDENLKTDVSVLADARSRRHVGKQGMRTASCTNKHAHAPEKKIVLDKYWSMRSPAPTLQCCCHTDRLCLVRR